MPDHSYVTIRSRLSASVQDILGSVTEKLQYSEEPAEREEALILVAVASSGGEDQHTRQGRMLNSRSLILKVSSWVQPW